jgi:hypothetical protein
MLFTKCIRVVSIFLLCACSSEEYLIKPKDYYNLGTNSTDVYKKDSSLIYPHRKIISDPENESLAHGSRFIVSNRNLYFSYYSGRTTTVENIEGTDIKVCIARYLLDLNIVEDRRVVLSKSDSTSNGFIQSSYYSPYDPALIMICDTIRVWMILSPTYNGKDADRTIGFRDISVKGLKLSPSVHTCYINYFVNGESFLDSFSMDNLAKFANRIRGRTIENRNMGAYPVLNGVKWYNDELYTVLSFVTSVGNNSLSPCILKSRDQGLTWNYVCSVGEQYDLSRFWEVDWAIIQDKIFIVSRSVDSFSAPCFVYDILSDRFIKETVLVNGEVDDSRPCVFTRDSFVYVVVNAHPRYKDVLRTRIRLLKLDRDLRIINQRDLLFPDGCSYFSVKEINDRVVMVYSEDYRRRILASKGDIAITDITDIVEQL